MTSSSPKVIQSGDDTLIFVYVTVRIEGELQGELFVIRDGGQPELLDRKALGRCVYDVVGDTGIFDFLKDFWDVISSPPIDFDTTGTVLGDGFVDPTIAIDTERERPLIAIADNLCNIGAYEWDGTSLNVLWRQTHDLQKHSSTVVLPNGLMIFGRKNGQVFAHDVESGTKMWAYDAGEPVFATPSATLAGRLLFVLSRQHIHVVDTLDGMLVHDEGAARPRKLRLFGPTYASPAVSANRVYVSEEELLTLNYDFTTRAHSSAFFGNRLSSVAIGNDGSVYAVQSDGRVVKYPGEE